MKLLNGSLVPCIVSVPEDWYDVAPSNLLSVNWTRALAAVESIFVALLASHVPT
jgi:hypothetical protein